MYGEKVKDSSKKVSKTHAEKCQMRTPETTKDSSKTMPTTHAKQCQRLMQENAKESHAKMAKTNARYTYIINVNVLDGIVF